MNEEWVHYGYLQFYDEDGNICIEPSEDMPIVTMFREDGTYEIKGSEYNLEGYAVGTYHYQKDTGEIFVTVKEKGIHQRDKPYICRRNFTAYYKILGRDEESINAQYLQTRSDGDPPAWKEKSGRFSLIDEDALEGNNMIYIISNPNEFI